MCIFTHTHTGSLLVFTAWAGESLDSLGPWGVLHGEGQRCPVYRLLVIPQLLVQEAGIPCAQAKPSGRALGGNGQLGSRGARCTPGGGRASASAGEWSCLSHPLDLHSQVSREKQVQVLGRRRFPRAPKTPPPLWVLLAGTCLLHRGDSAQRDQELWVCMRVHALVVQLWTWTFLMLLFC